MKVEFDTEQEAVIIKEFDNKNFIYICLNGERKEKYDKNADSFMTVYEYDYEEIIESAGILDLEDIKKNPSKYLNYYKKTEETVDEKIDKLQQQNQMLTDCILEMSELLYV